MTSPSHRGASRCILVVAVTAGTFAFQATSALAAEPAAATPPDPIVDAAGAAPLLAVATRTSHVRHDIRWLHRRTQHLSQTIRFRAVRKPRLHGSLHQLLRERTHWRRAYRPLAAVSRKAPSQRFRRWSAWMCIHRHEGPWNDTGAPYYGGLQMDLAFQRAYGAYLLRTKGTADNWTPVQQVAVAERAWRTRGFHPWPNTARACGLL